MFQDLKEYQDLTRIYNESVNISEEQKEINKLFLEADFTAEEIQYLDENFDELWESEFAILTEESIIESIKQENLTEEQLDEILGLRTGVKLAGKLAKKAAPMLKKGIKSVKTGVKDTLSGAKTVAKRAIDKAKPILKKVGGVLKRVPGIALPAAAVGGTIAAVNKLRKKGKAKRDAELDKKIKQGIKDSGMGDKGTAITQKGKEQAAYNRGERAAREKLGDPTLNSNVKKKEPPKATETEAKPKKMHPIEKKNRARLGDAKVDKLKAKQVDFKAMKKGNMSKDDFIKKYPNSITAQKSKGLRDHTEWDAYDMVLEYLFSTEQVTSLEEANYVMMEMDQTTIGDIVKEVKEALIQDIVEMQGQVNRADIIGGTQAAKNAAAGKGKYTPGKGVTKDFKLDPSFKLPKV